MEESFRPSRHLGKNGYASELEQDQTDPAPSKAVVIIITDNTIEVLLGGTAQGADPIGRQILKICAFLNAVFRVSLGGAIFITAQLTSIDAHSYPSFRYQFMFRFREIPPYMIIHVARIVKREYAIFFNFYPSSKLKCGTVGIFQHFHCMPQAPPHAVSAGFRGHSPPKGHPAPREAPVRPCDR